MRSRELHFLGHASCASGVACRKRPGLTPEGFVRVKSTLQAINYAWIFAAGDVAAIEDQKLPKSGVFALRMAKPLEENLRAYLSDGLPRDYRSQRHTLIGTTDGRAVASYDCLAGRSTLFWYWKNRIDRRFLRQLQRLSMPSPSWR